MSENSQDPNAPDGGAPNGDASANQGPASLVVLAQYLKDLSFESPRAPEAFQDSVQPEIDVNVDVNGRALSQDTYEVEFSVSARASRNGDSVFIVEATYAGVFEIKNLPREHLEIAMLVECPRLLFPFMRQIIGEATRNGNFPPLMLDPIDFMGVYMANKERMAQQPAAGQA